MHFLLFSLSAPVANLKLVRIISTGQENLWTGWRWLHKGPVTAHETVGINKKNKCIGRSGL